MLTESTIDIKGNSVKGFSISRVLIVLKCVQYAFLSNFHFGIMFHQGALIAKNVIMLYKYVLKVKKTSEQYTDE